MQFGDPLYPLFDERRHFLSFTPLVDGRLSVPFQYSVHRDSTLGEYCQNVLASPITIHANLLT